MKNANEHEITNEFVDSLQVFAEFICKKLFGIGYIGDIIIKTDSELNECRLEYLSLGYIVKPEDNEDIFISRKRDIEHDEELKAGDIALVVDRHNSIEHLIDTLLHELIHYELIYKGFESDDESVEFRKECRKLGVSSNYSYNWDKTKKDYVYEVNIEKMQYYLSMFYNNKVN